MPAWRLLNDHLAHSRLWQAVLLESRRALFGPYLGVRQSQKVFVLSSGQLGDCQGTPPPTPSGPAFKALRRYNQWFCGAKHKSSDQGSVGGDMKTSIFRKVKRHTDLGRRIKWVIAFPECWLACYHVICVQIHVVSQRHVCWLCSTSLPGGNQVDGLPPALTFGVIR